MKTCSYRLTKNSKNLISRKNVPLFPSKFTPIFEPFLNLAEVDLEKYYLSDNLSRLFLSKKELFLPIQEELQKLNAKLFTTIPWGNYPLVPSLSCGNYSKSEGSPNSKNERKN